MRIVAFSDIHGNGYAFDAFLKDLKNIEYDELVFCGDIFGYYYNQIYLIENFKKIDNLIWIKGNHEQFFLDLYNERIDESICIEKYGHSYCKVKKHYKREYTSLINSLPTKVVLEGCGKKIGIFHGTPEKILEGRLYPNSNIENEKAYLSYDIVILGHTHFKMARYVGNTLIVNPGSLGQPRDGRGYGYVVIDVEQNNYFFRNVMFDEKKLYSEIDKYDPKLDKLKKILERKEVRY